VAGRDHHTPGAAGGTPTFSWKRAVRRTFRWIEGSRVTRPAVRRPVAGSKGTRRVRPFILLLFKRHAW